MIAMIAKIPATILAQAIACQFFSRTLWVPPSTTQTLHVRVFWRRVTKPGVGFGCLRPLVLDPAVRGNTSGRL